MKTIVMTLRVSFDEVENLEAAAFDLEAAIRNRIFGEGVFSPKTMVDTWSLSAEILTLSTDRKRKKS